MPHSSQFDLLKCQDFPFFSISYDFDLNNWVFFLTVCRAELVFYKLENFSLVN